MIILKRVDSDYYTIVKSGIVRKIILLLIIIISIAPSLWAVLPMNIVRMKIESIEFKLEVASTKEQKHVAFLNRSPIVGNKGILFKYAGDEISSFSMYRTQFDVSVAYINVGGKITAVFDVDAHDSSVIESTYHVDYVLFLEKGMFDELGLKKGDVIEDLP